MSGPDIAEIAGKCLTIAEAEAQRCRDNLAKCSAWSPAQAEWSRARDACLNIADEIRNHIAGAEHG